MAVMIRGNVIYLIGEIDVNDVAVVSHELVQITDRFSSDKTSMTDIVIDINGSYIPITSLTTLMTRMHTLRGILEPMGYDLITLNTGLCAGLLTAIWITGSKCGYYPNAVFQINTVNDEQFEVNDTSRFVADLIRKDLKQKYREHFDKELPEGTSNVPEGTGSYLSVLMSEVFPSNLGE